MHAGLYDAFLRVCFDRAAERELTESPRAFLEARGVPPEDVEAMLADAPRLLLYRALVRGNLHAVVAARFERTRARMGDAAFDATFDAFLEARGPRTHYLRDVPGEFLAWALERWRSAEMDADDAGVPPYLRDLARYELLEFEAATRADDDAPAAGPLALDRPLVFHPATRVARFEHAVHQLPEAIDDRAPPARREVTLLVYRDADHALRYLELSPFVATMTLTLLDAVPLDAALASAAAAHALPMNDALLADVSRLLADFGQRGVVLGGALPAGAARG